MAVGDVDGDGHLDLVVANEGSPLPSSVSVLRGRGDGTFASQEQYFLPVRTAVLGDVDGDGHVDIVVAQPDSVVVMSNNGDGTFSSTSTSPFPCGRIAVADVDGDGQLDVLGVDMTARDLELDPGSSLHVLLHRR